MLEQLIYLKQRQIYVSLASLKKCKPWWNSKFVVSISSAILFSPFVEWVPMSNNKAIQ
jgi:hypothetical protein